MITIFTTIWLFALMISTNAQDEKLRDTLFLGDSLTVGIDAAVGLEKLGADIEAKIGRSIYDCFEAAKNYKGYNTVIISIGTNDYGSDDDLFIRNYSNLINRVKENNPNATIYINTIPGCNEEVAREKGYKITNAALNHKNEIIKQLAKDNEVLSIDINAKLGAIGVKDTIDGIHMKEHIYKKWFDIIDNELFPKKKMFILSFAPASQSRETYESNLKNAFQHFFINHNNKECGICNGG